MFTKNFKQISKKDVDIAGGKGASLGEMTRAKITVPPGFVVLAQAFDKFLKETDLEVEVRSILKKVSAENINSVEKASVKIRDLISDAEFPEDIGDEIKNEFKKLKVKHVAVRSSATAEDSSIASWAGELESYLNVTGKNLLESVKKCWSSLFTPRAIFYRCEKNLQDKKVSVAVVIQDMVQSEISGIVFTVHPITEDRNQMVIEAGYGLGELIVGGMITPDTYVISKKDNSIIDVNVSEQKIMMLLSKNGVKKIKVPKMKQSNQKLEDRQIIELSELCARIEKHYKFPQDIEFAAEGGKIYIVQSRPITTLK